MLGSGAIMSIMQQDISPDASHKTALPSYVAKARRVLKSYTILLDRQGSTVAQIGEACGLGEETLRQWRREEGLVQVHAPPGHSRLEAYLPELKESWDRGELLRVLADRYGTTSARISTFAKKMGWPRRSPRTGNECGKRGLNECAERIKPLWDQGLSSAEIGARFGFSDTSVRRLAVRMGWPRRITPETFQERDELVFQALQQGLSIMGVARYTGIQRGTVSHIIRRHGWRARPGASDELAGAPTLQEQALRPKRPGPLRMPKQPPPRGLPEAVAAARQTFKDFALDLNQSGTPIDQVCDQCGIDPDTMARWRREAGMTVVCASKGHSWFEAHSKELRRDWIREEESLHAIARRYGVHSTQIGDFAREQGWPKRSQGRKKDSPLRRNGVADHRDLIRELWDAGQTGVEIGRRIGFTASAVTRFARQERFPHRPNQRERHEELVFQCLHDGISQRATAMLLGLPRIFVTRLIRDRGWRF